MNANDGSADQWQAAIDAVRAAGVAEGIRQAREAVARGHGGGTLRGDSYTDEALERIDALGEDDTPERTTAV